MGNRSIWRYEARITFGLSACLPLLMLPLYALYTRYVWPHLPDGDPLFLTNGFELVLPLAASLAAAHLMAVEREVDFAELRLTYAENPWRIPLVRTTGALCLTAGAVLLTLLLLRFLYGPFPVWDVLQQALAPTLYLLGIALLVSNLAQNYWAGLAAALGYWMFEFLTRGEHLTKLFLFNGTWPIDGVDHIRNRWWLAGLGMALLMANGWVSARRKGG